MKILLAPSETKTKFCDSEAINQNSFIFPEMFDARTKILKFFEEEFDSNIFHKMTAKAMKRYDGVAFDAISYDGLDLQAREYIDQNTIIFSNIFGPILGGDKIPFYTFKQGTKLSKINIEKYYNELFSKSLDIFVNDFAVDLRAGFYEKFYVPKIKTYTYKFIKNGKVVSHWAKFYRGILLRNMALNNVQTQEQLLQMQIENLKVSEIFESKNKIQIVCQIME